MHHFGLYAYQHSMVCSGNHTWCLHEKPILTFASNSPVRMCPFSDGGIAQSPLEQNNPILVKGCPDCPSPLPPGPPFVLVWH